MISIIRLSLLIFSVSVAMAKPTPCTWCVENSSTLSQEALRMARLDAPTMLKTIQSKGIAVKVFQSSRKFNPKMFHWGLYLKPSLKLEDFSKEKTLFGKTLCKGELPVAAEAITILIADDAPKSTLIHEYLHTQQIAKMPTWCAASKQAWTTGSMPKADHDNRLIAEWDVHKWLWQNKDKFDTNLEDAIGIASNLLERGKDYESIDADQAKSYIKKENVDTYLKKLLARYMKEIAPQPPEILAAENLLKWLDTNRAKFAACTVTKESGAYKLCDNTEVNVAQLKEFFAMPALDLVKHLESMGIKIEILCDQKPGTQPFASRCQQTTTRKSFSKLTSLHGQYIPDDDTILIKSSASKGSLIHEYVHRLESKNQTAIYGKVYKQNRNEVQKNLVKLMDEKIAIIGKLEASGKKDEINLHLPAFMTASELMHKFAPWQDLIDERGIFLLYLKYGSEFGAAKEDLDLARTNMGHICNQMVWRGKIPPNQCNL